MSLAAGQSLPHFEVTSIDGRSVAYRSIWQRKHVVLVLLDAADTGSGTYADALRSGLQAIAAEDTECVVTHHSVASILPPAVVIADRWGEIAAIATGDRAAELPDVDDVLEWVEYLRRKCPECEGEAR